MSNTFATRAADSFLPPALSATDGYCSTTTGPGLTGNNVTQLSATSSAQAAVISMAAGKKGYITVQNSNVAGGASVYVAFKKGTAAASVTSTTGYEIPVGVEKSYFFDTDIVNSLEYITATGTGTLKYFVSSPVE